MSETLERRRLTYSRREGARAAGVGLNKIDEMIARGLFPVIRDGRRVIIPAAPFERFLSGE